MLIVKDLDKLEIYKMTYWSTYFKYNNKKYMFHTKDDWHDGITCLYSKHDNGKLDELITCMEGDFCSEAYKLKKKKSMPYKYIDKKEFCNIFRDFIKLEI